jgi:uncharacterized protein (TIGR04255 family)
MKEDAVPVELPSPDRTILEKAPLQLVVCQVRFDEAEALNNRKTARRFFDKLGGVDGPFPKFSQIQTQRVTVNPQALPGETPLTEQQRGWRFSNPEGDRHLALLPGSLALETTAYRSWDEFAPYLERALNVLADEVDPAIEQRLGLRFVNLIVLDEVHEPSGWMDYIAADLVAPGGHPVLGPGLVAAQHRVVLDLGDGLHCLLNYGLAPDANGSGRVGYLLDLDVFRERSAPFSAADVFKASQLMNDRAVSLFQQVATPELLALLRREEETASQGRRS